MTAKLLSLDVWDTLLRRRTHPEAIKRAACQYIYWRVRTILRQHITSAEIIYQMRLAIESRLGKKSRQTGRDDEYELTDVLRHMMLAILPENSVTHSEFHRLIGEFYQYEIDLEIEHTYPDPMIENFITDYPAEKTIFLSDFYLNSTSLQKIMAEHGLHRLVPMGFSSVDLGINKRSGKLFRHVQQYFNLADGEYIHIGDNAWSDYRVPNKIGITAILYQPKPLHQKRLQHEAIFTDKASFLAHWRGATETEYAPPTAPISPELTATDYKEIWSLGVASAPLWVGLCAWIAEQALVHKLERIFFLTREGEFFYQIYRALLPDNRLNHQILPKAEILGISRQASFAASLTSLNMTEMNRSWSLHKVQNLRGFFALFGLDPENFSEILVEFNLNIDSNIANPMNDQNFANFINHPVMQTQANQAIARQKALLIDYARQCGINSGDKIGLVDIGWRGGIMDNLTCILPDTKFYGLFLGLRRYICVQSQNGQKFAYGLNENLGDSVRLFESFAALEALCQARAGSVIGYERVGDKIQLRRPVTSEEQTAYDRFTLAYQDGVIAAAQIASKLLPDYAMASQDLKPAALAIWRQLQSSPPRRLASEILSLPQHDIFGLGDVFRMADVPSMSIIILSPFMASKRHALWQFIRRAQWSSAIFAHREISWPHRILLFLVFKAANWLKILLIWRRRWYR